MQQSQPNNGLPSLLPSSLPIASETISQLPQLGDPSLVPLPLPGDTMLNVQSKDCLMLTDN